VGAQLMYRGQGKWLVSKEESVEYIVECFSKTNFVIYGKLNLLHTLMDTQTQLLFGSSEVTHFSSKNSTLLNVAVGGVVDAILLR
jgi:hypothetical protein